MFYWQQTVEPATPDGPVIEVAFTDRVEGSPSGPYGGFNLGGHVGDDLRAVERNRNHLARSLDVPRDRLLFMRQVHGTTVLEVDGPWGREGSATEPPECDGMVTRTRDLALAVLVADCVPLVLLDQTAAVVGVVHAGRPGMVEGIVPEAIRRMRALGAREITAVVGPSVCGRCYEVPEDLVLEAAATSPVSATRSWSGTPAIDVAAGVVDQLTREGVAVQWVPGCTREAEELYSYRREPRTGRFAGVVVMRSGSATS